MSVKEIKNMSKSVDSKEMRAQVATVSAGNNEFIGNLIADCMESVGTDGVITVEESKTFGTDKKLLKVCNLTKVTFHHISLQTLKEWNLFWKMLMFFA